MGGVNRRLTREELIARRMEQESQIEAQARYEGKDFDTVFERVKRRLTQTGVLALIGIAGYQIHQEATKERPLVSPYVTLEDEMVSKKLQCLREEFKDACENPMFESDWKKENCQNLPEFETLQQIVKEREKIFAEHGVPAKTETWVCSGREDQVAQMSGYPFHAENPKAQTPLEENQSHLVKQQQLQTPDSY